MNGEKNMTKIKKHTLVFYLMIVIGLLFWSQMGMYFLHEAWGYSIHLGLLEYCLSALKENSFLHRFILIALNVLILYSVSAFAYILFKQMILQRQWSQHVRQQIDVRLTEKLNLEFVGFHGQIIAINDFSRIALTYGFFRPRIVISTAMIHELEIEEIRAVLLHEYAHLRRHDPLRLLIMNLIKDSLPMVPVFKKMHHFIQVWMEIEADQFALKHLKSPYPLASVIYKCANSIHHRFPVGVGFADDAINYRIQKLVEPKARIQVPFMGIPPVMISCGVLLTFCTIIISGCS